jgi:hypothetical protein
MNTVICEDYKVGEWVVLQMDGLALNSLEYFGKVKEVGKSHMKVEVPFYSSTLTHTLQDGQQVTTIRKD